MLKSVTVLPQSAGEKRKKNVLKIINFVSLTNKSSKGRLNTFIKHSLGHTNTLSLLLLLSSLLSYSMILIL